MELYETMSTLRAVRRLRSDPIPDDVLERVLTAATWAPTGGNHQPWEFIVITERELVTKIGELYRDSWLGAMGAEPPPDESSIYRAARYLAHQMMPIRHQN